MALQLRESSTGTGQEVSELTCACGRRLVIGAGEDRLVEGDAPARKRDLKLREASVGEHRGSGKEGRGRRDKGGSVGDRQRRQAGAYRMRVGWVAPVGVCQRCVHRVPDRPAVEVGGGFGRGAQSLRDIGRGLVVGEQPGDQCASVDFLHTGCPAPVGGLLADASRPADDSPMGSARTLASHGGVEQLAGLVYELKRRGNQVTRTAAVVVGRRDDGRGAVSKGGRELGHGEPQSRRVSVAWWHGSSEP